MNRLIASASTEQGIIKLASEYFVCAPERLQLSGKQIVKDGKIINHLQVRRKNKRFRLEVVDSPN